MSRQGIAPADFRRRAIAELARLAGTSDASDLRALAEAARDWADIVLRTLDEATMTPVDAHRESVLAYAA